MGKWTQGPWRAEASDYEGCLQIISADRKRPITEIWGDGDDDEANARLIAAAPELVEALVIVHECGLPEKVSMYDEEGVEGWQWCHPDGRIWSEIGSWYEAPPMHPIARAALAKAGASPINIDTAIDNARGGK